MAKRDITPPPLHGPTAKEKKYDRQLRLWAASGQEALENAHVLLLNSGPGVVGVEILKNLILPGVGSFTIVDEADVLEEDLGVNFFLVEESLGKSRAKETCKYLTELNPDVSGHPVQKSMADFLSEPKVLNDYTLVLLIGPSRNDDGLLDEISMHCAVEALPLIYIHSVGFYSQFSVQLPQAFPIVDTHPDPASTQDLRLLEPWPELKTFMESETKDLDSLSDHDHGHVPYLLLLLRFLEDWKSFHDGNPPSDYKEKKEFKSFIESKARSKNPEGGEENFDEATAAVLKSLNKSSLPSGLREIFEDVDKHLVDGRTANFWMIASAIKYFYEQHHSLPLPGALPDMKAQSQDYIQLQNIYKTKARQDIEEVTKSIRKREEKLTQKTELIDLKEIGAFCKGAAFVKLIRGRSLLTSLKSATTSRHAYLFEALKDEDSLLPIFIAFLAYDTLAQNSADKSSQAGAHDSVDSLKQHTQTIISKLAATADENDSQSQADIMARINPILQELARAEGAELHNISALMGGMVAQEVIKIITKQYIPVDNTCVFDGITSKSAVFRI
ncbi:MAG: hypothetical protein Q9208_000155 [Pyrenodesmia sp. 3 TL-2023]